MIHPRIIVAKNPEEVGKLAADVFEDVLTRKPAGVIGLATGSTPLPLYRELIKREKEGKIDFSKVRSANLDEYKGLAPDHPQSYRKFMQDNLLDHISIEPENTIVPLGLAEDVQAMCEAYEAQIEQWGGVDLQLLGIGHDGHIGFNEPDAALVAGTHITDLTKRTIEANARFFESENDVPKQAITMGMATIMKARSIVCLITGKDKNDVVKQLLTDKIDPMCPATFLKMHNNVTILCDVEAYNG